MMNRSKSRREQAIQLSEEFGIAVAPLLAITKLETEEARRALPIAVGQTESALREWVANARKFMISDGMSFKVELVEVDQAARNLIRSVQGEGREIRDGSDDSEKHLKQMGDAVQRYRSEVREILLSIPTELSPHLLGPKSPYTAYLLVKDELLRAKARVHYFDRYLDSSYFDLYMRKLPRT